MTQPRTALVIGGGVAGTVAAMALQRAGVDATVYEARPPSDAEVGSYLTVAVNGLDALRAIDAHAPVLAVGFPTRTNVLWSGTGKRLGAVSNGGALSDGTVSHTMKRAHLHRALEEEAARRGIAIAHGQRLVDAETTSDGVVARFDDGSQAVADLLVGADGVHSVVRRLIDPDAPGGRYVGLVNFGGYTPQPADTPGGAVAQVGEWHMIFGRRAFFGYAAHPDGGTVWFANVPRPPVGDEERARTTAGAWQRQLVELLADDRGPASSLIAAGTLELAADNIHDLPSVPAWRNDAMVVIGDAAHAPSPSSGQGASMAAEDGVVLARCLRDQPDVAPALAAYERARRARVERIVKQGARTSSSKAPGPVARVLRDLMLPFVFRRIVTEKSQSWLFDHHLDWDTPAAAGST